MHEAHVGKTCPFCQTPLKAGAALRVCTVCRMPHHEECWQENHGCTTFGCPENLASATRGQGARLAAETPAERPQVTRQLLAVQFTLTVLVIVGLFLILSVTSINYARARQQNLQRPPVQIRLTPTSPMPASTPAPTSPMPIVTVTPATTSTSPQPARPAVEPKATPRAPVRRTPSLAPPAGGVPGVASNTSALPPRPQPAVPAPSFFTLGSTQATVRQVQGTPTDTFTPGDGSETWWYGHSQVIFTGGRVRGYTNAGGNLRIKLVVQQATAPQSFFTLGSTKDEVLAVQGNPTSTQQATGEDKEVWTYQNARVIFLHDRVRGYANPAGTLRLKLVTRATAPAPDHLEIGSTRDDLLALQGTPTEIVPGGNEDTWRYGTSTVELAEGKIKSFDNAGNNLRMQTP